MTNLYFFHLHACYSIFQNFFCAGIQFFIVLNSYILFYHIWIALSTFKYDDFASAFRQALFFAKNLWNRLKKWPFPLGIGEGAKFLKEILHVWSYFPWFICIKGEGGFFNRTHLFYEQVKKSFCLGLQNAPSYSK